MTYTFNRLRGKNGIKLAKPVGIKGVTLDIDKDRRAMVFLDTLLAELRVMEFEAHANGLFLRGYESQSQERAVYQEWFLRYETGESSRKGTVDEV